MDTSREIPIDLSIDPLSINYVRFLRILLSVPASWPYEVFRGGIHPAYWVYRRCVFLWALLAIAGELRFLLDNFKRLSFFELGHMYLTCFFAILGLMNQLQIRSLLPLFDQYGVILKEFLMSFHLIHYKHKGVYYQEAYTRMERLSYYFVAILLGLEMLCVVLFNLIPIANNISSGAYQHQNMSKELAVYFSYPHFDPQEHYYFVTAWNTFLVFGCGILIGGIDAILLIMIFQIIGHVEILKNHLNSFPEPENIQVIANHEGTELPFLTVAVYTDMENAFIKENIKQNIQHHLLIVKFTESVSEFFGPVLASYYLFHLVAGCLMLLEMSAGDAAALTRYGPLTVVIFGQLIALSMVFEVIHTKSEALVDTVYGLAWDSMSLANQRSLCVLLRRLHTPIVVKAVGVAPVNVQTMVAILKTSFSYFTFLKTLNN